MPRVTPDQYLAMERAATTRHELVDGVVHAMAGESGQHADISANLLALLVLHLKGTDCRARTKDTKVRSGFGRPTDDGSVLGMFSYPDIVVICGEPMHHDRLKDVVINPAVIVEVLSPSAEGFDRGKKFARYQGNETLRDYVLVSQDEPEVEIFTRNDAGWQYRRFAGLDQVMKAPSIEFEARLGDIYDRVSFGVLNEPAAEMEPDTRNS